MNPLLDSETPAANLPWLLQRHLLQARYQTVADPESGVAYTAMSGAGG